MDPHNSPIFDGSDTSMSGDGEYEYHNGTIPMPGVWLPSGKGGGCVKSGPFKEYGNDSLHLAKANFANCTFFPCSLVVNIGPHVPNMDGIVPLEDPRQHNPRCLRRDISVVASSENTRTDQIHDLITQQNDVYWFQETMQGDFAKLILGVHSGGHYTVGRDPGGVCFFSSTLLFSD